MRLDTRVTNYLGAFFSFVLVCGGILPDLRAETFCVGSMQELESTLQTVARNDQDDIVRIVEGAELDNFATPYESGRSVRIEGGYLPGCEVRSRLPASKGFPWTFDQPELETEPEAQQSTTGPLPPEGIIPPTGEVAGQLFAAGAATTQKTLGVPGYQWRHGCAPTALGMLIAYYDVRGYVDLFTGVASSQTAEINQEIASHRSSLDPGHYEDYALPMDDGAASPLADKSEVPLGDEHPHDSIADFMKTSWSSEGNFYGWTWSSDIEPAFTQYVNLKNQSYQPTTESYNFATGELTWEVLVEEIDQDRPMIFLVDTNADGYTDHFVTVVGYRNSGSREYACLDTWVPYDQIRWCTFAQITSGQAWGIWAGWGFELQPAQRESTPLPFLPLLLLE